jgi:hypothetical protein
LEIWDFVLTYGDTRPELERLLKQILTKTYDIALFTRGYMNRNNVCLQNPELAINILISLSTSVIFLPEGFIIGF